MDPTTMTSTTNGVNNNFIVTVAAIQETAKCRTMYPVSVNDDGFKRLITSRTWSPISFRNNHRIQSNFQGAELITLDFDEGRTLAWAEDLLKSWECWGLVGTTKSHGLEKVLPSGKILPACDRFRLVLKGYGVCTDLEKYRYNLSQYISSLGADRACKDGSRLFFACKDIAYFQDGASVDWLSPSRSYLAEQEKAKARFAQEKKKHKEMQTVPSWISYRLEAGAEPGKRKSYCYAIARGLAELGHSFDEILEVVTQSPLAEIGELDVRDAVRYGHRKGTEPEGEVSESEGKEFNR